MKVGEEVDCFYDGKGSRRVSGKVIKIQGFLTQIELIPWGQSDKSLQKMWIKRRGVRFEGYLKTTDVSIHKELCGCTGDYYSVLPKIKELQ